MKSMFKLLAALACALALTACGGNDDNPVAIPADTSLSKTDLVVGTGTEAVAGNALSVVYTGWLYDSTKTDGKGTQFDANTSANPLKITLGQGLKDYILGFDQGLLGMRAGGKRRLVIGPSLAYGLIAITDSSGNIIIPAGSTLVFDVEVLTVDSVPVPDIPGLTRTDLVVGMGTTVGPGDQVSVVYTGWLQDKTKTDGKGTQFDANTSANPLTFVAGRGASGTILGFDQGVVGMKVGGKRRLVIEPALAYGASEIKDSTGKVIIPANSTLVFEVDILAIKR